MLNIKICEFKFGRRGVNYDVFSHMKPNFTMKTATCPHRKFISHSWRQKCSTQQAGFSTVLQK